MRHREATHAAPPRTEHRDRINSACGYLGQAIAVVAWR